MDLSNIQVLYVVRNKCLSLDFWVSLCLSCSLAHTSCSPILLLLTWCICRKIHQVGEHVLVIGNVHTPIPKQCEWLCPAPELTKTWTLQLCFVTQLTCAASSWDLMTKKYPEKFWENILVLFFWAPLFAPSVFTKADYRNVHKSTKGWKVVSGEVAPES